MNLAAEHAALRDSLDAAIARVLSSGRFILDEEVQLFEAAFARAIGARYAVALNSGTDAVRLALKVAGVGPGDEVITVAHTFISTVDAIVKLGATPVFVDIDRHFCMDPALASAAITPRTKAILPVHLYGHPCEWDPLQELADQHGLPLVEDACQAHGATYRGRPVGSLGRLSCFSFYPTKNLGAWGDGGLVATNDSAMAERLRMERNYGQRTKNIHEFVGENSRLDELQAAVLRVKLAHLEQDNERRRAAARLYGKELERAGLGLPVEAKWAKHVYHLYVVRHPDREALRSHLSAAGVQTQIHYPTPVHLQPAYHHSGNPVARLPRTEQACREILSLPMYPSLLPDQVAVVAQVVQDFAGVRNGS